MNPRVSNQKKAAMTLVEVLVVICTIVLLIIVIAPAFIPDHPRKAPMINCVNNLKQIGIAFRIWAGDYDDKYPMEVSVTNGGTLELTVDGKNPWLNFLVMSNDLVTPRILVCPADKDRAAATNFTTVFSATNVSYFVGVDADENYPQRILSGDDNFEFGGVSVKSGLLELSTNTPIAWSAARHKYSGNICFADGSVQTLGNTGKTNLYSTFQQTGLATNRLAIP
jgi:prepilin-type processing-associated H-X9-DG protein